MVQFAKRQIVMVFVLLLGLAVPLIWLVRARNPPQTRLDVPQKAWVQIFFKEIDERTKEANLINLRTTRLVDSDIEVRLWKINGFDLVGIVLRRSAGKWSATYLSKDLQSKKTGHELLEPPRSGWEGAWERLVGAGLLTQPDGDDEKCRVLTKDGLSYIVESNLNNTYRTYIYGNPQLAVCDEAKQMIKILQIVDQEFGLEWAKSDLK